MSSVTHDPYLNTVKRNLQDKRYKKEQEKLKDEQLKLKNKKESKSFLMQRFDLSDHINLPDGTANIVLFIAFLVLPYTVGIIFIFVAIARASLEIFYDININEYAIYWAIGYEILAFMLLLLIVKSAITFKKS